MIRKYIFIICVGLGLLACNDDDKISFDVPVEFQSISFKPVPGGAVMHYKLPDNMDIFGVRARYTNAYGEMLIKDGSYLSDSISLTGFTEAQSAVPVQLSFFNSEMQESQPMELTFETEASAAVAVFDNLIVRPFWGGFNVTYTAPETVEGTIHVFYIGTNPATPELDSILMGSYPIIEGGDTLNFELQQTVDQLNVVVRTDDYDGHRVKMEIFEDVPALVMAQLTPDEFEFSFTGTILEMPQYGFSLDYLFDGNKKGEGWHAHYLRNERRIYDTFMVGPEAFGERFIFDLGSPKVPAALYGYAFINYGRDLPLVSTYPQPGDDNLIGTIWSGKYYSRLPCVATVYGTNEDPRTVDLSTCAVLYQLNESYLYEDFLSSSWCRLTNDSYHYGITSYGSASDEEIAAADPVVLRMLCNYTGDTYRYLILVVDDTYRSNRWGSQYPNGYEENADGYLTFDEMEVYVLAE